MAKDITYVEPRPLREAVLIERGFGGTTVTFADGTKRVYRRIDDEYLAALARASTREADEPRAGGAAKGD